MQKNTVLYGTIFGLLFPLFGFFLWRLLFTIFSEESNPSLYGFETLWDFRTACLLAIAFNLIPVQMFKKRRFFESMRGVIVVMGVLAIVWFFYFKETLFTV